MYLHLLLKIKFNYELIYRIKIINLIFTTNKNLSYSYSTESTILYILVNFHCAKYGICI